MRKVIEPQMKFGETNIRAIKFDPRSRDEIPKLLRGLQYIYCTPELHDEVFAILEEIVPQDTDPNNGRPGMKLWKILVLGSLRLICNWDYDKLKEIADNHRTLRQMLGHGFDDDDKTYPIQTLKDNISLLTPEILDRINRAVIKAGVPQELGLPVCILKDQHGFILYHRVMQHELDVDAAIPMTEAAKERFPMLTGCSYDKGFYSPSNLIDLHKIIDNVVLPKKGRLSVKDREREYSSWFIDARRQHPAVESAINALENHGLDRCPDHGIDGFERYVGLSIVARDLQLLGNILQQKQRKRLRRLAA